MLESLKGGLPRLLASDHRERRPIPRRFGDIWDKVQAWARKLRPDSSRVADLTSWLSECVVKTNNDKNAHILIQLGRSMLIHSVVPDRHQKRLPCTEMHEHRAHFAARCPSGHTTLHGAGGSALRHQTGAISARERSALQKSGVEAVPSSAEGACAVQSSSDNVKIIRESDLRLTSAASPLLQKPRLGTRSPGRGGSPRIPPGGGGLLLPPRPGELPPRLPLRRLGRGHGGLRVLARCPPPGP